jgi:DNA-binding NarL/FixJ family response regulator
VTEATVRSQVKAILRKLDVNSQIAAVAAYQEARSSTASRTRIPLTNGF